MSRDLKCPHCGQPAGRGSFCLHCGQPLRLGKYPVRRLVARGGMGSIFLAHHPDLDRPVAIKLMNPEILSEEGAFERFRREALIVAKLRHPGVVQIHDVASDGDKMYLVMEWIDGVSVGERLAKGPLPPGEAARIAHAVAETMAHAHRQGILHRDLKPSNIMIESSGSVRLLDFGLAKFRGVDAKLTRSEELLGTPAYMPPEMIGEGMSAIGPAADIYSLGATLYEMLAGGPPYAGTSPLAIMRQIETTDPAPLEKAPPALAAIVRRAMARDPRERFADMSQFARAIVGETRVIPPKSGRRGVLVWAGIAAGVLVGSIALALAFGPRDDATPAPPTPAPSPAPDPMAAVLEPGPDRAARIAAWLESTADADDEETLRRRAVACRFYGRYREGAPLALEAGDPDEADLSLFYAEAMPLLVVWDNLLGLGESEIGRGAQPTLSNLLANLRSRRLEVAEAILQEGVPDAAPADLAAARAILLIARWDIDGAEATVRDALAADRGYPPLLWLHAVVAGYRGMNQLLEARRNDWRQAADPFAPDAAFGEAVLLALRGDWAGAQAAVEQASGWRLDEAMSLLCAASRLRAWESAHPFEPQPPEFWPELTQLASSSRFLGACLLRARARNAAGETPGAKWELVRFAERHPNWGTDDRLGDLAPCLSAAAADSPTLDHWLTLERLRAVDLATADGLASTVVDAAYADGTMPDVEKEARLARAMLRFWQGRGEEAVADLDRLYEMGVTGAEISQSRHLGGLQDQTYLDWLNAHP